MNLTNASGIITRSYNYDAFGNERNPDANDTNPWRYCGEFWDVESNNYQLRMRYYNPTTGRFLTEDPIRHGLNWYTYARNTPVMFIDPSGLAEVFARAYAEHFGATVSWTGNTTTNGVLQSNATVTYNGKSVNITGNLVDDRLMIDDSVLNRAFGWRNPWIAPGQSQAVYLKSRIMRNSGL